MLKKLESALLYLVLKSVDHINDDSMDGCVIHPNYLDYIMEEVQDLPDDELADVKHDIEVELYEGEYQDNGCFLENLDQYFSMQPSIKDYKGWNLYKIIKKSFESLVQQKANETN